MALLGALGVLGPACGAGGPDRAQAPFTGTNEYAGPLVTPVPRPPSVPAEAEPLAESVALGRFERRANAPPAEVDTRVLEAASCEEGVIVFRTTEETIYSARGCDGFWTEAEAPAFLRQRVAIELERTDRYSVMIETVAGAQARFTVGGVWVEPR